MNTIRSTDIAEPNGQLLPLENWSVLLMVFILAGVFVYLWRVGEEAL